MGGFCSYYGFSHLRHHPTIVDFPDDAFYKKEKNGRRSRYKKALSQQAMNIVLKMQQYELTESVIYEKIAKFAKGEDNKATLQRLAHEEYALLEQEVEESVHIRQQEEEHEHALLDMLDEERLRYVGSMVLGLSDALVELTGSLAGFTFALQNNRLVALSGLIVGISATFSMASSEFLSAKSEGRTDALKSCAYTGVAYLITVVALILPYLLFPTQQYIPALLCMLCAMVLIIAAFTYYTSVAQDQKFGSRFLEMAGISMGVAIISFVVGTLAERLLGI